MVNITWFSDSFARPSYHSRSFSAVTGRGGIPSMRRVPKSLIQRPYSGNRSARSGPSATSSPTTFKTGCSLLGGLSPVAISLGLLFLSPDARRPLLTVQLRLLVRGEQEAHEDEGLEPRNVRVEPVVDGELERDDDGGGEGGQPSHGAPARHEGYEDGDEDGESGKRPLQESEGRHLGVDGPRAHPLALEAERALVEELRGGDGLAGEEQHGEGDEQDTEAAEYVVHHRASPPAVS